MAKLPEWRQRNMFFSFAYNYMFLYIVALLKPTQDVRGEHYISSPNNRCLHNVCTCIVQVFQVYISNMFNVWFFNLHGLQYRHKILQNL